MNTKKISVLALFTTFAIILSYVESFIPSIGVPGIKLGLANIVIVLILYYFGIKEAFVVNFVRIICVGFLFTNLFTIIYSIAGGLASIVIMYIVKSCSKLTMLSVSVAGGVGHNVAQLLVAIFIVDTYDVMYYLPILVFAATVTGTVIGIVSNILFERTKIYINKHI